MGAFVDILLVVIVLYYVFLGYKRGFSRSLISICAKVVSFAGGLLVSSKFAPVLYNSYFKEGVIRNIESRMDDSVSVGLSEQVSTAINSIPNVLSGIAKIFGVDTFFLEERINSASMSGDVAVAMEEAVVGPVVIAICRIIIFAVVSAVMSLLVGAIVNIICGFVKLPVLKKTDELFATLIGLINGVFSVLIVSYFLVIATSLIDSSEVVEIINSSIFVDFFAKIKLFM